MRVWLYARLSNDDNVSGMSFSRRGLDALAAAAQAGKIDAVLTKDLSRLCRHKTQTIPIMIAQLRAADYSNLDLGKVYMFILLAILPVLLVYIFLSRYIVKGVTAGSVKG